MWETGVRRCVSWWELWATCSSPHAVLLVSHGVHLLCCCCCSATAFSTVTRETGSLKHGGHSLIMKEYSAYSTVLGLLTLAAPRRSSEADKHSSFFIKFPSGHVPTKCINNANIMFMSRGWKVGVLEYFCLDVLDWLVDHSEAGASRRYYAVSRTCL